VHGNIRYASTDMISPNINKSRIVTETGNYSIISLIYAMRRLSSGILISVSPAFNPAFERLTGYKSRRYLGWDWIFFSRKSKIESLHSNKPYALRRKVEAVEIPILRVDGQIRTVLWNSANVYDNDGKQIIATIAQGQDITGTYNCRRESQ